jgi:hypothetical protein
MPVRFPSRRVVLLVALGIAAPGLAQEPAIERSFAGGSVRMDLGSGHYRVMASSDDRIRVTPVSRKGRPSADISVRLDVNFLGTRADLRVTGPKEGFDAEIELPKRIDVVAKLAGGSLRVNGVEGSKNIDARGGDVEIGIGDPGQYKRVVASVGSGELTTSVLQARTSDSRSVEWTGNGAYDLRVRVDAGRVSLTH